MKYTEEYLGDLKDAFYAVPQCGELDQKTVLITGAGGLICSAVVDALMAWNESGNMKIQVYAGGRSREKLEDRFQRWLSFPELHIVQYDAQETFECDVRFDYVIHGASNATPKAYGTQQVETMMTTITGTYQLLQYLRENGAGRFLYISSSEVYGKKGDDRMYSEDDYGYVDILNPRSCYPSSKRAAETLCASFCAEYGVDCVIVRPGHIYGPTMTQSDNRVSSQFPRDVKAGKDIVLKSAGNQLRSYCYVIDCVSAILTALIRGERGQAYNISNPNSIVTIREMAEAFSKEGNCQMLFENPSDEERDAFNFMENSSLTSSKLEDLGWKASFDMETGAKHTLNSI